MINYDDHLQFAEKVIARSTLNQYQITDLRQLIQRIQQRKNDPNLYLAVIGEFSSGKSTFINALLRDDLLKTSALVTTAAATRLRYGKTLDVKVNFANVSPIYANQMNNKGTFKIQNISENSRKVREFINKLTSEEEIAKNTIDINIFHPATFLQNDIVIIDLPGTNATNKRHAQVTREVVEKEADAAIIIIPATQPLTDSLTEFIRATIRLYLHRCIFVVSRMDQIPQREHKRMLDHVRNRLLEHLQITPDKLYYCSAQAVMDDVIGEQQAGNNSEVWINQFTAMQVEIINKLHSERRAIINENLQRLFSQLFEQMESNLQSQWTEYRKRETQIETETIQDIESFKNEQYRECIRMVDTAITRTENKINDCIDSHREQTLFQVRVAVFGASSWDNLKYVVNNKVTTILRQQQNLLNNEIQSECRNLSQSAQEAGKYFDKKFTEVYRSLRALGGQVQNQSVFSSSSISISTSSVIDSAQELNSSSFSNAISGFFSHFFAGILDGRKQEVWDEIRPRIYDYFATIKKQVQPTVRRDAENIKVAINQRIYHYIHHYKSVVEAMKNEQKMELQRLTHLQANIQYDLAEIERRRLQIIVE